jgi:hypothetical protein
MLGDFRSGHRSIFSQAIYIVSVLIVFSYVFFEVLDLDGSDFPRPHAPVERNVVIAEVPKEIKITYWQHRADLWVAHSVLLPAISSEALWFRLAALLTFSPLNSARARGYRVALPRSSPTDPFHSR